MGELGVAVVLLQVLEPLEVQGQNLWQPLHSQPLGCLLLAAAYLTVVLILCRQCLRAGELSEGRAYLSNSLAGSDEHLALLM